MGVPYLCMSPLSATPWRTGVHRSARVIDGGSGIVLLLVVLLLVLALLLLLLVEVEEEVAQVLVAVVVAVALVSSCRPCKASTADGGRGWKRERGLDAMFEGRSTDRRKNVSKRVLEGVLKGA